MIKNFNDFVNENLTSLVNRYKHRGGFRKEDELTKEYVLSFLYDTQHHGCKKVEIVYKNGEPIVNITGDFVFAPSEDLDSTFEKLPFKFGEVTGDFDCASMGLTTLDGCPQKVGGNFDCSSNDLTSLVGGPTEVGGRYECDNNNLENLKGAPTTINDKFNCGYISNLEGCPKTVKKDFRLMSNELSEDDVKKVCKVGGNIVHTFGI